MRIDSHQHFWRLADRAGQWPPPGLAAIHRDFAPEDLLPALRAGGVAGTVVVQSLPDLAETQALLALADRHPFILGVVGWADLKAPDAAGAVASLALHPKLRALRPMLQDIEDVRWIDDSALDPAAAAMREHRLCLDALVRPEHLPGLLAFAHRHGDIPIVVDHAAKPDIAAGACDGWRRDMAALARHPNVRVKLSGLLTEAGAGAGAATLRPYIQRLVEWFGFDRMLWGSDWPVLLLAGSYDAWLSMCLDLIPEAAHDAVFAANARSFYRLDEPVPR